MTETAHNPDPIHQEALRLAAHGLGFEACLANPTIRRALENVVHARHRAKEPA